IFVLPSLSEAQGKVILEAQARSVPVIASKVGGIPTLIQDRSNGLLVRAGSPQALAAAIEEIIADVPLREHIINAGLMTARRFTMEEVTEEQIRLLNEHFGLGIQRRSAVAT
ncbi:MAG TPA: glycosyltransferase family 4 protein, partial [Verrucomicrobiae bacterium]|nr:glycosyltransferase family 4 protein [Verrucomicrobiae bacterium]